MKPLLSSGFTRFQTRNFGLEADWITKYVIPQFEAEQKKKGVDVKVTFNPNGVDDEAAPSTPFR